MATVLVIDDHAASRDYLQFLLEHTGHRVIAAEDGSRGLELARQENPALIISDILMPTMDGIELARRLHADVRLARIPLIFYTATYREREAERVAKSVGADRVLLLTFSRRQVLQPMLVELNSVVAEMDRMLKRLIGENIALVTRLDPAAGLVRVDSAQIEQVLMNLAVNARDAMPKGGQLTLETAPVSLTANHVLLHPEMTPGAYAVVAVSDSGCGMDEDTLAHMFEPFFTTKKKGEGTGLGLSIVYGIVQQSGGHIRVYSEPGRGTTFRIYLPREGGPADERVPDASREAKPAVRRTVLLVEDEPAVRKLAAKVLTDAGYAVLEADGAEAALDAAAGHGGEIHLLVSDVVMPAISGPELLERVRERRPRMRALFVSGYTDAAAPGQGVLKPGTPFLAKPFSPAALSQRVREVLEEG